MTPDEIAAACFTQGGVVGGNTRRKIAAIIRQNYRRIHWAAAKKQRASDLKILRRFLINGRLPEGVEIPLVKHAI